MGRIKKPKHGPEYDIQKDVITFLEERNWFVKRFPGSMFLSGVPDIYAFRRDFGERWIDLKAPGKYSFTDDQKRDWPVWESFGIGIWILTAATQREYDKLFQPPNWRKFWKRSWGKLPDIDSALDQIVLDDRYKD